MNEWRYGWLYKMLRRPSYDGVVGLSPWVWFGIMWVIIALQKANISLHYFTHIIKMGSPLH
jgi:hypothetical protein